MKNNPFDSSLWTDLTIQFKFVDITYHLAKDNTALRIAFNRPDCRNAFRPKTVDELLIAFEDARQRTSIGCVILTGNGPSSKDGGWAFSSGGDQRIRKKDGYSYEGSKDSKATSFGRLHILEVQRIIRFMPKVVKKDFFRIS